ncbi:MAG: DNA-protecting protein DprA, partial [Actinobacteria bacterium]|nr:DNA-protecting protein DprA [Actinomycetota bacterium]
MSIPEQSIAAGVLASLPGITPVRLRRMLDECSNPLSVLEKIDRGEYSPTYAQRWKGKCGPATLERLHEICDNSGIGIETLYTDSYPHSFRSDRYAPAVIFYKGNLAVLNHTPIVCIVGTRAASPYGIRLAHEIGFTLARVGITVVSGLAVGIDTAAHRGAIDAIQKLSYMPDSGRDSGRDDHLSGFNGNGFFMHDSSVDEVIVEDISENSCGGVVAVLAGGPDISYPAQNQDLFREILSYGVSISELPPGMPAARWRFVARNRIMAAMSSLVVVVESHAEGGALHTVHQAEIRGIPVAAVPGSVTSSASEGCNALIKAGRAHLVTGADDIISLLGCTGRESLLPNVTAPTGLLPSPAVSPAALPPLTISTDTASLGSSIQDISCPDYMERDRPESTRYEIFSKLSKQAKLSGVEEGPLYAVLDQLSAYPLTLDEIVMRL